MRPRSALVLGTCCLSLFLTGLDNTAVNVGLPSIGAQLHAPVACGALAQAAGWRAIFWANIPVGLAAICLTGVLVPDSKAASHA